MTTSNKPTKDEALTQARAALKEREELIRRLNACADDPMWADHAEISKATLRKAAALLAADDKAGGEVVAVVDSGLSGGIGWTEAGCNLEDGQELFTRPQPQAAQPAERVALTEAAARNLCTSGPVYAPDGVVTRGPNEYRRDIEDAMVLGLRKGEAAHGIAAKDQS